MDTQSLPPTLSIDDISAALDENLSPVIYRAGAKIFRQGEIGGCAYVIERGQVGISRSEDNHEKQIATLGPGELLGEMSPIDNKDRSATATAIVETELIPISRAQFLEVIRNADPLVQLLINVLIDRLRNIGPTTDEAVAQNFQIVTSDMKNKSIEAVRHHALGQLKLETEIRDAFSRRELDLYYQPIVRLEDAKIAGFEALIRWISPQKGIVGPDKFIGVAEESGLIVPIGLWIIEHACHMLQRFQRIRDRHWPDERPLFVSANVSARQLRNSHDVDAIIATIRRSGIDPQSLKIEITEGLLLDDPEIAIKAFTRLRSLGVKIALDDFGTGYSSLSYLHRFPLDTIKIDRSFVISMLQSRSSMTVVKTITRLAQDLDLSCVSEGIENHHELTTLRQTGCEYGQGYLFSRPLPDSTVAATIEKNQLWSPSVRSAVAPTDEPLVAEAH